jgi:DNA invertase Pin-like site-specific DNA recombinase
MQLIGYIRVSRVGGREGDSFISPDVQREQIAALAVARGHDVIEWIEDLDEPGTKYDRPGFQRALEMVESGAADGIAAAKLDRFARSVIDGRRALQRLRDAGGSLVLVAESLDTTTPMGKAMFTILLAFAELEVDRIRESWQVARTKARERGVRANVVPFGYRLDARGKMIPDSKTCKIALRIFERRAAGENWRAIARWLDEVAPRPNGGAWPRTTVSSMVKRRVYLGEGEGGARHKAIVPRATWEAAQKEPRSVPRYTATPRLLTGIIYCSGCGVKMEASRVAKGGRSAYYKCRGTSAKGVCQAQAHVSADAADEFVENALRDVFGWFESIEITVETTERGLSADDLAANLQLAEDELAAFLDLPAAGVAKDVWVAAVAKRQAAIDEARDNLRAAESRSPLKTARFQLLDAWSDLPVEEKRKVVIGWIERVEVGQSKRGTVPLEDRLRIVWSGPSLDELELVARAAEMAGEPDLVKQLRRRSLTAKSA